MKISAHDISINSNRKYVKKSKSETKINTVFNVKDLDESSNSDKTDKKKEVSAKFYNKTLNKSEGITLIKKIRPNILSPLEESDKNFIKKIVSKSGELNIEITEESANIKHNSFATQNINNLPTEFSDIDSMKLVLSQTKKKEINELTIVDSEGIVETEDGREISFGLHLEMEREFSSEEKGSTSITFKKFIDPLVIQLESGPPSLSDKFFSFDLNTDGKDEKMRSLGKGSGFLAFDINNDGKINDGSELFGTESGNGFKDLAKYDDDKNGWIDENDEIFSKLSVWRPKTDEEDESIKDLISSDVGAIYLGYGDSEHSITDEKGNNLANLKSSGVYLKESGEASQIYQIDMADLNDNKEKLNNNKSNLYDNDLDLKTPLHDFSEKNVQPLKIIETIDAKLEKFMVSFDIEKKETSSSGNMYENFIKNMRQRIDQIIQLLHSKKIENYKAVAQKKTFNFNRLQKVKLF